MKHSAWGLVELPSRPVPTRPDIGGSQVQIVKAVEGRRVNGLGL